MATSQAAVANGDHAIPADAGQAGYPAAGSPRSF